MNSPRPPTSSAIARPSAATTAPAVQGAEGERKPSTLRELVADIVYTKIGDTVARILPKHLNRDAYQASLVSLMMQNPELVGCELPALAVAVFNAARCGLDVNPVLGHVYLTPQKVRVPKINPQTGKAVTDGRGKKVYVERQLVRMMVGYKGFIFLGRTCGLTPTCDARVVYEKDIFEWDEGVPPKLLHRPSLKVKERGDIYAAYARAQLSNGAWTFRVIDMEDVERSMRASATAYETEWDEASRRKVPTGRINPNSPWGTDYAAMVMKTAVRRFYKQFDLGDPAARPLAAMMHADDEYTAGRIPLPTNVTTNEPIVSPAQLGGDADWGDAGFGREFAGEDEDAIDAEATEADPGDDGPPP